MRRRCIDYLGGITGPIDEWLDRNPGGKVVVCEANRLKYKGNWKLAYDNSGDGYHVVFSHRSLLEMENRLADEANKGMSYYKGSPDSKRRCTCATSATAITSRTSGRTSRSAPAALWAVEGAASRHGALRGGVPPPLRRQAPTTCSTSPAPSRSTSTCSRTCRCSATTSRCSSRSRVDETNVTWYGTAVVDDDGALGDALDEINALRMRTQEQFPNFGEVDDLANFEEIQRGLACLEDEWVYMHRGLGIPGRVKTDADGIITAPATDEAFMREYIKEWKRLMKARARTSLIAAGAVTHEPSTRRRTIRSRTLVSTSPTRSIAS